MELFDVANFDEIGSTNERVKRALREGVAEGYVCRARSQTGGYGRQGRLWTSPKGGLYQSVLLRPTRGIAELPTLGFVVALSIRAAILRLAALPDDAVQVKWPNDVMAGDRKIAGISMEALSGGVCIGMGVNVFRPGDAPDLLADGKYEPAFFEDLAPALSDGGEISFGGGHGFANRAEAIAAVGDAVLSALGQCYPVWLANGFAPFIDEYKACSYLQGKHVRMQLLNGTSVVEGTVVGVGDDACLLVDDGERVVVVNSGEAHIL